MKPEKTQPHVSPWTSRYGRGFTLVEMLVVITIIVALAAVALVATRSFRNKAYQANAMATLRQVAAFNIAYAGENNGNINTLRYDGDKIEGPNWVKNTHWGRLQPYMFPNASGSDSVLQKSIKQGLDGLFNTDTATKGKSMPGTALNGAKIYGDRSGLATPFSYNANLAPWNNWVKMGSVADTSQTLYFTYGFANFKSDDCKEYVPIPRDGSRPTNNIFYFEDQKTIAAFLDGHVELIAPPFPDRKIDIK